MQAPWLSLGLLGNGYTSCSITSYSVAGGQTSQSLNLFLGSMFSHASSVGLL